MPEFHFQFSWQPFPCIRYSNRKCLFADFVSHSLYNQADDHRDGWEWKSEAGISTSKVSEQLTKFIGKAVLFLSCFIALFLFLSVSYSMYDINNK